MSDGEAPGPSPFASSRVVVAVFDDILAAIFEGRLLPGQRISDSELAEQLGVSRTPVREALQRLRELGIIEASANRFTRVAEVTPKQTADAMVVWLALYSALIAEVIPAVAVDVAEQMRRDHDAFLQKLASQDFQGTATANLSFFTRLVEVSSNATLQRAITSVMHIVRLGSLHLPQHIDFDALIRAQKMLVEAAATRDAELASRALGILAGIEVPQDAVP